MTALIAKRKVGVSWREAVASRASERGRPDAVLREFDRLEETGLSPGEAAYRALEGAGLLWTLGGPGVPALGRTATEDVPAV